MAVQILIMIMDVNPRHVLFLAQIEIGLALRKCLENSLDYIDLVEQSIKLCEKLSQDRPDQILKHNLLQLCFQTFEFFDKATQSKILKLLLNVSEHASDKAQFDQNFTEILKQLCFMLGQNNQEIICHSIVKMFRSYARLGGSNFSMFKEVALTMLDLIQSYSVTIIGKSDDQIDTN